jgi:hypothetical protein
MTWAAASAEIGGLTSYRLRVLRVQPDPAPATVDLKRGRGTVGVGRSCGSGKVADSESAATAVEARSETRSRPVLRLRHHSHWQAPLNGPILVGDSDSDPSPVTRRTAKDLSAF